MTLPDTLGSLGLLLVMGAFIATLTGRLRPTARLCLVLNGLGAGILAWYSAVIGVWIFFVLEGVWSLVAWWSLMRIMVPASDSTS
jgi:hypothetical protein